MIIPNSIFEFPAITCLQKTHLRRVRVADHNERHEMLRSMEKANSPDTALSRIRDRAK